MLAVCKWGAHLGLFRCEKKVPMEQKTKFMEHVAEHGLSYGTDAEFDFRMNLFLEKDKIIEAENAKEENTFKLGHNHMSTWTHDEYTKLLGYQVRDNKTFDENVVDLSTTEIFAAALAGVDWRSKNAVTPIKDQGRCGSCWAFSTTGSIEGADAIKMGTLQSFSEQQLVDCSTANHGCKGGSMDLGFMYAEQHPLELESEYRYTSGSTQKKGTCKAKSSGGKSSVHGYKNVARDNASALKAAVTQGPVSIAIEADKSVFQMYRSGVFNSRLCGTKLDHGVLLVGYGEDYWILKNSWGTRWGEQGYMQISNKGNVCGLEMQPSYAEA